MDRKATAYLAIVAAGMLAMGILWGISGHNLGSHDMHDNASSPMPARQDTGNATGAPDDAATRIALADPAVASAINNSYGHTYTVDNVSAYGDDGRSGFIGRNGSFEKVSIVFGNPGEPGENRGVIVDVKNGTVAGMEQYFRRLGMPPYSERITVPPGQIWYHWLQGAYQQWAGVSKYSPAITFSPDNATVFPFIVDQENFTRLMNGQQYAPLAYLDPSLNRTVMYDGTQPIPSKWSANISIPDPRYQGQRQLTPPEGKYYLVLKNGDLTRDVAITYDMGMPTV